LGLCGFVELRDFGFGWMKVEGEVDLACVLRQKITHVDESDNHTVKALDCIHVQTPAGYGG
jgi:hypothetical protein